MYHFCCWSGDRNPRSEDVIYMMPGGIPLDDAYAIVRHIAIDANAQEAVWYLGSRWCGEDEESTPQLLCKVAPWTVPEEVR
jgi:hypothetical protein